jgi:hypothetical protein
MLHLTFVDSEDFYGNFITFEDRENIQFKFCQYMEHMYYFGHENKMRNPLVCKFLKEVGDIYWIDDYTIMMHEEHREPERAVPMCLDYSFQLTMQLIYLSQVAKLDIYLMEYIPWIGHLAWISRNCPDMNIYIGYGHGIPIDSTSESECAAAREDGLFDFIFRGEHYDCNTIKFLYSVLREGLNGEG